MKIWFRWQDLELICIFLTFFVSNYALNVQIIRSVILEEPCVEWSVKLGNENKSKRAVMEIFQNSVVL